MSNPRPNWHTLTEHKHWEATCLNCNTKLVTTDLKNWWHKDFGECPREEKENVPIGFGR